MCKQLSPLQVMAFLNTLYSKLDALLVSTPSPALPCWRYWLEHKERRTLLCLTPEPSRTSLGLCGYKVHRSHVCLYY